MSPEEAAELAHQAVARGQAIMQAALTVEADGPLDGEDLAIILAGIPYGVAAMLQVLGERGLIR